MLKTYAVAIDAILNFGNMHTLTFSPTIFKRLAYVIYSVYLSGSWAHFFQYLFSTSCLALEFTIALIPKIKSHNIKLTVTQYNKSKCIFHWLHGH